MRLLDALPLGFAAPVVAPLVAPEDVALVPATRRSTTWRC